MAVQQVTPEHRSTGFVLKRIRKGVYEYRNYLVVRTKWINENWDGPRDQYRPWRVYKRASWIANRVFLDSFRTRTDAQRFLKSQAQP